MTTRVEDDFPPVMADGEKLGQAFIYILIKAIESSDPFGKICVTFWKIIRKHHKYAGVIIGDEGPGIVAKLQAQADPAGPPPKTMVFDRPHLHLPQILEIGTGLGACRTGS